jgi:hypothetical protein
MTHERRAGVCNELIGTIDLILEAGFSAFLPGSEEGR